MQKIEIVLEGTEAEKCARLISDLAASIIKQYDVAATNFYCGHAAIKKGLAELQLPSFVVQAAPEREKASKKKRKKR